jgi:hypothetical protein
MDRLTEEKEETVHRALDRRGGGDRPESEKETVQVEGQEGGDSTVQSNLRGVDR